jgi:hypothetical protein
MSKKDRIKKSTAELCCPLSESMVTPFSLPCSQIALLRYSNTAIKIEKPQIPLQL